MIEDAYDLREKISDYESLGLTRICDEYLYGDRKRCTNGPKAGSARLRAATNCRWEHSGGVTWAACPCTANGDTAAPQSGAPGTEYLRDALSLKVVFPCVGTCARTRVSFRLASTTGIII